MLAAAMKVLITGGAGFIGSHVAEALLNAGHEVVVADNLSAGSVGNIPRGVRFYLLDVLSPELNRLFELEKPEVVNHHAAQISVTVSAREPMRDATVNALGTLNVLEACVRHGVGKLIFISTGGALYGDTEVVPTPEDHPTQPMSPYGIHKRLGEEYLRFYSAQHGLRYTVLRYANVYGPRQDPHGEAGVVSIFINQLREGKIPTIFAYPDQPEGMLRDYVYVEDVARASVLAMERGAGERINIGTGIATSTGALYRELAGLFTNPPTPRREAPRAGELRRSCLDIGKAKEVLGWAPAVDLHEGIARTVRYFS
jgi:UDP-glucose 4-epimerase